MLPLSDIFIFDILFNVPNLQCLIFWHCTVMPPLCDVLFFVVALQRHFLTLQRPPFPMTSFLTSSLMSPLCDVSFFDIALWRPPSAKSRFLTLRCPPPFQMRHRRMESVGDRVRWQGRVVRRGGTGQCNKVGQCNAVWWGNATKWGRAGQCNNAGQGNKTGWCNKAGQCNKQGKATRGGKAMQEGGAGQFDKAGKGNATRQGGATRGVTHQGVAVVKSCLYVKKYRGQNGCLV